MGDRAERDTMPADHGGSKTAGRKTAWFGWMVVFGVLGTLTTVGLQHLVATWCERNEVRTGHAWMATRCGNSGKEKSTAWLTLTPLHRGTLGRRTRCGSGSRRLPWGRLSDARLGRLRELPNLKCIVFLCAHHHDAFALHARRGKYRGIILRLHSSCSRRSGSDRPLSPLEIAGRRIRFALGE